MDATYLTPVVVAAAGGAAGGDLRAFLGAALGAALAAWWPRLAFAADDRFAVSLEPDAPDDAVLLESVRTSIERLQRTGRAVSLRISAFRPSGRPRVWLRLTREGDLAVARDGRRERRLKRPGLWIADHPVPLELPCARCLTLRLAPSEGGRRVRASRAAAAVVPRWGWFAAALLAGGACAGGSAGLLGAALGFAVQARLFEHHARRAEHQG
jgi:hypothetical protein